MKLLAILAHKSSKRNFKYCGKQRMNMDEKKTDRLKTYPGSVLDQGYGVVGKRVMRDRTIKIGSKGLYCYLCVYGKEVFPKRDTICYDLGISRDTYNSYLKELVEHGYVSVKQQRGEGNKFAGNLYTINIELPAVAEEADKPQRKISATEENAPQEPCPKIPCTEKPATEKPCTENSAAGVSPGSPAAAGVEASLAGANNTNNNSTSNNQYNTTTTQKQDKVNIRNGGFSSAGDIITAIRQSKGESQVSVVVDESVRALMDLGEKILVERKTVLSFISKYGEEAVKTQLENLQYAVKRGKVDNPGGWLNAALKNGYSNLAAEKARVKHDEVAKEQAAIAKMLEADAKRPAPKIDKDNVFYQMHFAHLEKKAEG